MLHLNVAICFTYKYISLVFFMFDSDRGASILLPDVFTCPGDKACEEVELEQQPIHLAFEL